MMLIWFIHNLAGDLNNHILNSFTSNRNIILKASLNLTNHAT